MNWRYAGIESIRIKTDDMSASGGGQGREVGLTTSADVLGCN